MLKGKTALITGGGRGIGRAIAKSFAENGANVAIIYAGGAAAADEVCALAREFSVKAESYCCDVSDFEKVGETVKSVIADFGGIDILVNNAGIVCDKLLLSMKEEEFKKVIDVNLCGCFNTVKHCYSHMMKRRSGRIINMSSVIGLMGNAGQANYAAAKAGIIGFTKSIAKELAARGVTCNAIAPGFIETDMTAALSDKVKESMNAQIPMRRAGTPDEVAGAALFLASDAASYITGEVIRLDGGMCM